MIPAEMVKERVSVPMLLERYGVKPGRGGRCACPIHHGHNPNMAVKPRWFRCYRCGKSGTVIDLQMALSGAGFNQAIDELDGMFGLNLSPHKPSQRIAARLAIADHRRAQRTREARQAANGHNYALLCYLRRFCAPRGADCRALDSILDYYQGYDGDDIVPDAFMLAEHAGLGREMGVMIDGAIACAGAGANDGR